MEVRFKLERAEFEHSVSYQRRRHPKTRNTGVFFVVYLAASAFLLTWLILSSAVFGLAASAVTAVLARVLFDQLQRKSYRRLYDIIAPDEQTALRVDPASLFMSRGYIRSEIDWAGITELTEDSTGFYLTYGPLQSVYVPRRAFATAEDAQQFWSLAQEYRQFARPTPANPASAARV